MHNYWEVFFEFCIQKSLKATIYGWTIKGFTNFVHEALEILAVVYSLDCCLFSASLSRACSFSSTTNRFYLHDFVANNFMNRASDTFPFPALLETLTFNTSWLTAVETINYICTYLRYFVAFSHTDCKLLVTMIEIALGLALFPQT